MKKPHCHVTTLSSEAGYARNTDPYDVILVILEDTVETLVQRIGSHSVIFYAAGEPHGARNPSCSETGRYAVFKFLC